MLRPEGMGDAAARFAGADEAAATLDASQAAAIAQREAEAAAAASAAAAQAQTEEAERARLAAAEEERLAEEARQRAEFEGREQDLATADAATRWANRERYGRPNRMMVSGGLGLVGILNPTPGADGGLVGQLQGRFGYSVLDVPGLEIRGGLDIAFGATGGFALTGGAVYLASPWRDARVHIGGGLEVGYYQAVTGNRVPQLIVRAEAIVSWHATDKLWLEAALPSFSLLSANGGVLTLGGAIRAGTRF